MSKDTGGPAFPQDVGWVSPNSHVEYRGPQGGMTLRDYFAAKALQPYLSHLCFSIDDEERAIYLEEAAEISYQVADAMLKAREQ